MARYASFVSRLLLLFLWIGVEVAADNDEKDQAMARLVTEREKTEFFVDEFLWGGDAQRTKFFLNEVWNGDKTYFAKASCEDTDLLWSLKKSEYYIRKDPRDWIYKEDMQVVKDGKHILYPSELATWRQIQSNLDQGYTIVLNGLHNRHPPISQLCSGLEEQLGAFVQANVYWTPPGSTGFDPHYDWHDIMVLQLEGSKTWTVCGQRPVDLFADRKDKRRGIFRKGDNLGSCTSYNFQPGDVFYAPPGTIHYATADNNTDHSIHLTLSLDRTQFLWGKFLREMVESKTEQFSAEISSISATSKPLHTQIPIEMLRQVAKSLDNADLSPIFLMEFHTKLRSLVQTEFPAESEPQLFLLNLLTTIPPVAFDETVDLLRHKLVMGRSKVYVRPNCTGSGSSLANNKLNSHWFRRVPSSRLMLVEIPAGILLVLGDGGEKDEHLFKATHSSAIRYALGSFTGSRGSFFTGETFIRESGLSQKEAFHLLGKLMDICLLEGRSTPPHTGPEASEICEDLDENCAEWASWDSNECQTNANYMMQNCRKACGACPSQ